MLKEKTIRILFLVICIISSLPICYGQYKISGYIDAEQKNKTVYLSLLKYDEETMITENQILFSTQTNNDGYFEFKGQLLSEKDKLYRIHSNINTIKGLQLVSDNEKSNYYNFIFSNRDTIYFQKSGNNWFSESKNSNSADIEWRKLKSFEEQLEKNNAQIKNKEAQQQAVNDFAEKVKSYSEKSIKHSLLKLLAFSDIKKNDFNIKTDFEKDEAFYDGVSNSLKSYYGETSYYLQYQDEISKISNVILQQKYAFQKKLNYALVILVFILILVSVFQFRKLKALKPQKIIQEISNLTLTNQEEKITKLILEDKSNKEIANELFISLSTVKTHIRNLYAKLDVTNRHELVAKLKNHPWD
ncbi:response regulator transcription factor [Flavobacterium sp. LHD-85]|uniref:response regulator transcription factor n=1 Tax=Flavobacterium sp. LHD-85 TaxID=3071410 RepID=UPI0027E1AFB7|nr:response regulator transcription factor [Flavobacterium sp. LHD-85]MDQ6530857.1 response regulator transcription factor [Flavobacterium sp. LHD-85]